MYDRVVDALFGIMSPAGSAAAAQAEEAPGTPAPVQVGAGQWDVSRQAAQEADLGGARAMGRLPSGLDGACAIGREAACPGRWLWQRCECVRARVMPRPLERGPRLSSVACCPPADGGPGARAGSGE